MLIDKRGYEAQYLPVRPALFFIALVIAAFSAFLACPPLLHAGTDGPEAGVKIVEGSGYVKDYTVLEESVSGNMVRVKVRATVAVGDLKGDLDAIGVLYGRAEMPRVLFMIAEQSIGDKHYFFWWWGRSEYRGESVNMSVAETVLKEAFIEKGFNVVDVSGSAGTFGGGG